MPALSFVTNLGLFVGLSLAIGSVAARWWVVPPSRPDLRHQASLLGVKAAWLLVLAILLVFVRQLIEFRDPFSPWVDEAALLLATAWGRTWVYGAIGSLAIVAACRADLAGWRGAGVASGVLILAWALFPAATGHANAGDLRVATLAADVVHIWAMGVWIGALAVVLTLERTHRRASAGSLLPDLVPRFSPLALVGVAALSTTGLFASWIHLDGVRALVDTPYGRLLLAKLGLVGIVLVMGWRNFRRLTPRLDTADGAAALRRSATYEVAVALVVLCVTAVLVRTSP